LVNKKVNTKGTVVFVKSPPERHCEEQSDEAIQLKGHELPSGLLRYARNDDFSHSLTSPETQTPMQHVV
jgi:hypothetical protein